MSTTANDMRIIAEMRKRAEAMSGIQQTHLPSSVDARMQEIEHQLGIQHQKIIALENDNMLLKEIIEELENVG